MTKREREQLRAMKGETKKLDRVADKYAEIALGLTQQKEVGYSEKSMKRKQDEIDGKEVRSKRGFKANRTKTRDWERVWCEFCKHPNPKTLMFCQLCDSALNRFKR